MSVRRRMERDPATGAQYEVWLVDVVFQRPDGRRTRVKKKSPVQTRRGAEEYERQIRNALLHGTFGRKEAPSFAVFAKEFQEVYVKGQLKWATQLTYESTIRVHLLPVFRGVPIDEISAQRVAKLRVALQALGRAKSTVRNTLGVLSRMLHVAKEWGLLTACPEIALPKVPAPTFRFLTPEERAAVLAAAGPYWYGPIYFALMTGCRQGEIWALEREQIDLRNQVVHIDRAVFRGKVGLPKHDKIRTVDMSAGLVAFLKEHLAVIPLKSSLVFPSPRDGVRLERRAAVGLNRVAVRAGLKPFGWHVLRHTFASNLVMKGVPVQVVQQLLGHSRIDETMRYAHLSPHMKRDAVGLLDELDAGISRPGYGPATTPTELRLATT